MSPAVPRRLETDPRWFPLATREGQTFLVDDNPCAFAHDAEAAHQLLALVTLAAAFLDQLEADPCVPGWLRSTLDPLREAFGPWAPKPDAPVSDWQGFMGCVVANLKASLGVAP